MRIHTHYSCSCRRATSRTGSGGGAGRGGHDGTTRSRCLALGHGAPGRGSSCKAVRKSLGGLMRESFACKLNGARHVGHDRRTRPQRAMHAAWKARPQHIIHRTASSAAASVKSCGSASRQMGHALLSSSAWSGARRGDASGGSASGALSCNASQRAETDSHRKFGHAATSV